MPIQNAEAPKNRARSGKGESGFLQNHAGWQRIQSGHQTVALSPNVILF
jgi:hypothetical protein